jgi:hypothetical protein
MMSCFPATLATISFDTDVALLVLCSPTNCSWLEPFICFMNFCQHTEWILFSLALSPFISKGMPNHVTSAGCVG